MCGIDWSRCAQCWFCIYVYHKVLEHDLMLQGCYWIMNPIDGLEGFENLGQYGIPLALLERGKVWLIAAHQQIHDSHCSLVNPDNAWHLAACPIIKKVVGVQPEVLLHLEHPHTSCLNSAIAVSPTLPPPYPPGSPAQPSPPARTTSALFMLHICVPIPLPNPSCLQPPTLPLQSIT